MEFKDYYDVLQVDRKVSQEEIKRSYRKLARKYHPDVNKDLDAEEKFKQAGEAYEVLKDPEKRSAYDRLGANWQAGQEFHPPPDWDQEFEFKGRGFADGDAAAFSDFFENLFGRRGHRTSNTQKTFQLRGQDQHARIDISIEDTYKGASRAITLGIPELTDDGHVVAKERTLIVKIPKGVKNGQHIRLAGQGGPGIGGGDAGDLFLEIHISPHAQYRVEGKNVFVDLPVAPWEAALGAKVKVPTPDGVVELKIPAGSAQGQKMRLKGRGIPGPQPGNLYAVLSIVLPPADTEKSKELYQRMAKEMAFDPRHELGA